MLPSSMIDFTVRPIREEDAESSLDLLLPIIEEARYTIMSTKPSVEGQREWIHEVSERGVCFVAIAQDETVLGIQSIERISQGRALKHVGDISTFVSDTAHRAGIGRALANETFPTAKAKGFLKAIAMIRADNPRAISYYASIGFTEIGVAKKHALVKDEFIDEVLMEAFL
jgi:L-amino acid N-acyltransferase YncA